MHFAARSALIASCLAVSIHALPVTYSVVDVDGGAGADAGATDKPATVYHTVTESPDVSTAEPSTVSVSVTIVETSSAKASNHSSSSHTAAASTSSISSSPKASASKSASSTTSPAPLNSATNTLSASSALDSIKSAISTPSSKPSQPATTKAPSSAASSHAEAAHGGSKSSSEEDCEASSVTVTATDIDETVVTSTQVSTAHGKTVTLLSTTTVTPSAVPTSYYDDGMWHTRYAIKPSAAPEAEKPVHEAPVSVEHKQVQVDHTAPHAASNASVPANGTYVARRQLDAQDSTPIVSQAAGTGASKLPVFAATGAPVVARQLNGDAPYPTLSQVQGTGAPEMLVHPFIPEAPGIAARAEESDAPSGTGSSGSALETGDAAAIANPKILKAYGGTASSYVESATSTGSGTGLSARAVPTGFATGLTARNVPSGVVARALPTGDAADVLMAEADPTAAGIVGRAVPTGYSVVSWNETAEA